MEDNKDRTMSRDEFMIANLSTQIGGMAATIADLRFTCTAMEQEINDLKAKLAEKEAKK